MILIIPLYIIIIIIIIIIIMIIIMIIIIIIILNQSLTELQFMYDTVNVVLFC